MAGVRLLHWERGCGFKRTAERHGEGGTSVCGCRCCACTAWVCVAFTWLWRVAFWRKFEARFVCMRDMLVAHVNCEFLSFNGM